MTTHDPEMFHPENHGTPLCFVFGHRWTQEDFYDTSCARCGFPTDAEDYFPTLAIPARLRGAFWRVERFWLWSLRPRLRCEWCTDCGKVDRVFGFAYGDHETCVTIPF
jgi:hypothetical protein